MIRRCVGALIYDNEGRIFLMSSHKWNALVVPGGRIRDGESEESALRREIREEMGIEISDPVRVGEKVKEPSEDFHQGDVEFHFIDYLARAESTELTTNHEITDYGWHTPSEALKLNLLDTTRKFIEEHSGKIADKLSLK